MSAAEKMRLRKELEKFHPAIKNSWKRDDLVLGKWFKKFLDNQLGAMAGATTPKDVREQFKGSKEPDDLLDDIVSATIHESILATDAYQENLSGTEIRNLKDRKPGGEQKLAGDTVAMVAEVLYVMKLNIDLIFKVAAAYEKMVNAGQVELFEEAFGRALGNTFDYGKAKKDGNALDPIGAKIWERAIIACVGSPLSDAQRKGFYCYYAKAIAKETQSLIKPLPKWEPPPEGAAHGGGAGGSAEEEPAAY
jgi:hypothetical protein